MRPRHGCGGRVKPSAAPLGKTGAVRVPVGGQGSHVGAAPELRATLPRNWSRTRSARRIGAPLVVAPLLDAAGACTWSADCPPADEPRLSGSTACPLLQSRYDRERPTEPRTTTRDSPGGRVAGPELFEHLEHSSRNRVDSRAYLAARLMDCSSATGTDIRTMALARFDPVMCTGGAPSRAIATRRSRASTACSCIHRVLLAQLIGFGDKYPSIWRLTSPGKSDRRYSGSREAGVGLIARRSRRG